MNTKIPTTGNNGFYTSGIHLPTGFNKLFDELFEGTGVEFQYGKFPSVNIREDDHQFKMEVIAPGFEKEEVKIELEESRLKITGEKKSEEKNDTMRYRLREFKSEKFSRVFKLNDKINTEAINAEYKNGILRIDIPKKENKKSGVIDIKIN